MDGTPTVASGGAGMQRHLYFHKSEAPADRMARGHCPAGDQPRALLVFLCPAEGPKTADDWSALRQVTRGHGIGTTGVVYLFTAEGVDALDLAHHPEPITAASDSALRAALRWVENPYGARGPGKTGRVFLCYGSPWAADAMKAQRLRDREAVLWQALRTFKRRVHAVGPIAARRGRGVNPLKANRGADLESAWVQFPPDGGPQPDHGVRGWWV